MLPLPPWFLLPCGRIAIHGDSLSGILKYVGMIPLYNFQFAIRKTKPVCTLLLNRNKGALVLPEAGHACLFNCCCFAAF